MVFAGGRDTLEKTSRHKKVNNSNDGEFDADDDDDDDDDSGSKDASDEDSEDAVSASKSDETASEIDTDDDDDDSRKNTLVAEAEVAVTAPTTTRKRRLQELEDFVRSESETNKAIVKHSASSDASQTKLVKFTADEKMDGDSDSHHKYREDIYGRLRDEHGNVVNPHDVGMTSGPGGAYVPPGKRQKLAEESGSCTIDKSTGESKQRVEKLIRQVKGQINRLDFILF